MGEQGRAFQAEGTAWRMLAEETKGGGQGLGWAAADRRRNPTNIHSGQTGAGQGWRLRGQQGGGPLER